ncbi:MAG: hypothetical protein BWY73_00917 [candidate division TA06 bacterium ADurb.Bin417]|uniref:Uncharacterized protein n=1 Tax=candidate division TA06 bacterium ADurb.Bin417 TaxID=1852828 RepID=A0A1V5MFZ1_UNCT6|nr:MAG: hypothetical protein BWY73_00917 [candidate division TA06 bacterium ADurb.Bin417]
MGRARGLLALVLFFSLLFNGLVRPPSASAQSGSAGLKLIWPKESNTFFLRCLAGEKLAGPVLFHFRPWDLTVQMKHQLRSRGPLPESLIFSPPRRQADNSVAVACLVYRFTGAGNERGIMGFELAFDCDAKTLAQLEELYKMRLLTARVTFDQPEIDKQAGSGGVPIFGFKGLKAGLAFSDDRKEVFKTVARLDKFKDLQDPGLKSENKTPALNLKVEFEDLPGVKYFLDWEPEHAAWYTREFNTASGRGVAVWQEKATEKVWKTKLPQSLPAGRYNLLIYSERMRHRFDQNIIRVTLNDCTREVVWLGTGGWVLAPVFETRSAGDRLTVEGIQQGSAGLNHHPNYLHQNVILLDRLFITTDLNLKEVK